MMARAGTLTHLIFVTLCTAIVAALQFFSFAPLVRIERAIQDAMLRQGTPAPVDPSLVFLARDTLSASLESEHDLAHLQLEGADPKARRALELMAHEWPWSREVHALVLERLVEAGARAVVFDFTFPKPSPNDDAFRAALDAHRDRVLVAGNISNDIFPYFVGPTPSLIPNGTPRDPRVGFDNFWHDPDSPDDIIRSARFRWTEERGVWRSDEEFSLAARTVDRAGLGALVPADRELHRFRFAGPPGTFAPRSIFMIFAPEYWRRNFESGAFFRDKIVVVGAHGNWQQDEHLTPFGVMPGPELHLNAINALLHSAFIRELPAAASAASVIALALVPALARRHLRRPFARFFVLLLGSALWLAAVFLTIDRASLFLPAFAPLAAFNFTGIGGLLFDIVIERREKTQLRRTLERYVSRNVVKELLDDPDEYTRVLGGELRPVTVLFSDVRNFSRFAARVDSRTMVAQLNEYFSAMVDCVFAHGGTLDKFIGDAVMAVWGNAHSVSPATDARNAAACALAMREALAALNVRWREAGKPTLQIGIGLNSGEVVAGNIGSPSRMEFTVIGDAVNMAWRLQEYTKKAGTDIVLGASVAALIGSEFPTDSLPPCVLADGVTLECAKMADDSVHRPPPIAH
jgi:adenylate cyclase